MAGRLLVHCGGYEVTREEVEALSTPKGTSTHFPIPHSFVIDEAEKQIEKMGYDIKSMAHALSHEDNRYFGLMELEAKLPTPDYNPVTCYRNAHDMAFAFGMAAGGSAFVCDNLMFYGDFKFQRKHTKFIKDDIKLMMEETLTKLPQYEEKIKLQTDLYKDTMIEDRDISRFIIECAQRKVIAPNQILPVWDEWLEPRDDFGNLPRNVWRLTNAISSIMKYKGYNIRRSLNSTLKLDSFVQEYFGLEDTINPPVVLEAEAEVITEDIT